MCDCININIADDNGTASLDLQTSGQINGTNYWTFEYNGTTLYISRIGPNPGDCFLLTDFLPGGTGTTYTRHCPSVDICTKAPMSPNTGSNDPVTMWNFINNGGPFLNVTQFETEATACPICDKQDRTKRAYQSIKLPSDFVEQARGIKSCCCEYLVLADPSGDTWKTDKTSAWIKISNPADTYSFVLKKNGVATTYTPPITPFPNDPDAYYTTINWMDVLTSDGVGCYTLEIDYQISGISGSTSWGLYKLQPYTIANALTTARVRAIFNGYQEIQGIDFTGADVESTLRFHGYIGNRQPNMETDNIIYGNREMRRVIRENLNTYQIVTDPVDECFTRPLIDLFLLSENQLFISDYNAHNHSYRYEDLPVIVSESPEVEYYDLSRKAKVTTTVSDRTKNKRTFYK